MTPGHWPVEEDCITCREGQSMCWESAEASFQHAQRSVGSADIVHRPSAVVDSYYLLPYPFVSRRARLPKLFLYGERVYDCSVDCKCRLLNE